MTEQSLNFRHRRISEVGKLVFFTVLSVILLLLDHRYAPINHVKSALSGALYPLQWALSTPINYLKSQEDLLLSHAQLVKENKRLQHENAMLTHDLNVQVALVREQEDLASVKHIQIVSRANAKIAQIIAATPEPLADHLLINQGSSDGVALGDAVADKHGLIGQVEVLMPFSAEVRLFNTAQTVVPVMVARTGARTLVYGTPNGLDLRYFPNNLDLQAGDVLITSGIDGVYPAGLPVASVVSAESGNGSPYYKVALKAIGNSANAQFVLVFEQAKHQAKREP